MLVEDCAAFGFEKVDPGAREVATSDVPTLILAGQLDVMTPPTWAYDTALPLGNAYVAGATLSTDFPLVDPFPGPGNSCQNCQYGFFEAFLVRMNAVSRFVMACAGLLLVAPSWESDLTALVIAAPIILLQLAQRRRGADQITTTVEAD